MADLQEDAVPLQNAAADEEPKKYHTLYQMHWMWASLGNQGQASTVCWDVEFRDDDFDYSSNDDDYDKEKEEEAEDNIY